MSETALLGLRAEDIGPGRPYLERDEHEAPWHDRLAAALWHGAAAPAASLRNALSRDVRRVVGIAGAHGAELAAASDAQLRDRMSALRATLRRSGFAAVPAAHGFALVREAAGRVIGKRHYDVQLAAGWWLLHGRLVEMATGEGKTFAATLPACLAAIAGLPVHVITVNDYLAARDAEVMGPLFRFFGLTVGTVVHGQDRAARAGAYGCDITYASNKELAFDYLRDRSALGDRASPLHLAVDSLRESGRRAARHVLRGLVFGIVDEADSVFIDEARTPLILSSSADGSQGRAACDQALAIARSLVAGRDFALQLGVRRVRLTDAGREAADALDDPAQVPSPFASARERDERVQEALAALHLYARDQHYVVVDGKVQIVDESTGRVMADRAWERGLHQLIEAKEGVDISGRRETLARITYQRLFRRYLRLSGMTGTATEVAAEIGRVYGLAVVRVPLNRPTNRVMHAVRCLPDAAAKWEAVAQRVREVAVDQGRPVLIGTRTVKASEQVSAALDTRGIAHRVLNAKQDRDEAQIIAQAGEPGRVTVATNMAGRGTDIALGGGVAERGGLHVILTEYHESRRIDRQLFGRCARQGDPGSGEAIVALDDDLFCVHAPRAARALAPPIAHGGWPARAAIALLRAIAQRRAEGLHRDARMDSVRQDRRLSTLLAFSGRGE